MMKFQIILTIFLFSFLSYKWLKSVHKSSLITALDKVSPVGRVTGRIHYHGYGQPFVYLETAEYREYIMDEPDPDMIAVVRQAGKAIMDDYGDSGRRLHLGALIINLIIYLVASTGFAMILSVLWNGLGLLSRIKE